MRQQHGARAMARIFGVAAWRISLRRGINVGGMKENQAAAGINGNRRQRQ